MGAIWSKSAHQQGISESASVDDVHASPEILWATIADIESLPSYVEFVQSVALLQDTDDHSDEICIHRSQQEPGSEDVVRHSSDVDSLTKNRKKEMMQDGTSWDEIRLINGRQLSMRKRVTSIETEIVKNTSSNATNNSSSNTIAKDFVEQKSGNVIGKEPFHCRQHKCVRLHVTFPSPKRSLRDAVHTNTLLIDSEYVPPHTNAINGGSIGTNDHDPSSCTATTTGCRLVLSMAFLPPPGINRFGLKLIRRGKSLNRIIRAMLQQEVNEIAKEAERRQLVHHVKYLCSLSKQEPTFIKQ